MTIKSTRAIEIFYSYANKDEKFRQELEKHLSNLKQRKLISNWNNSEISAGADWKTEINEHLNSAQVILLLVSPDFLASDYCYSIEMHRAMERHEAGEARIIPILLRPTNWEKAPFGKLRALPTNSKPVTRWQNRDAAFLNIAQELSRVVEELTEIPKEARNVQRSSVSSLPTSKVKNERSRKVKNERSSSETHILIIEDNINMQGALNVFLTHEGYAIDSAYNGSEALEFLHRFKTDIILLDLSMPEMEGTEFLRQLRIIDSETPVIVTTAYSRYVLMSFCLGADEYFVKPFVKPYTPVRLLETIKLRIAEGRRKVTYHNHILTWENVLQISITRYGIHATGENFSLESVTNREALVIIELALRFAPQDALAYYHKGLTLHDLNRYEEALAAFDAALRFAPQDALAHYHKGLTLHDLNRYEEALAAFDAALNNDRSIEAYYAKGIVFYKLKQFQEAFRLSLEAIKSYPKSSEVHYISCLALYGLRQHEEAIEEFKNAISLNENSAIDLYAKSIAYMTFKRFREALNVFEQCILSDWDTEKD